MNKYIIPICDIEAGQIWVEFITAKSISTCQDKLMERISDMYDINNTLDYHEFVKFMDSEFNVLIGDIKDIEEL